MHKTKDQRREEAQERQAVRDARSDVEQAALLMVKRPGRSKRETARLVAGMTKTKRADFVLAAPMGAAA